MDEATFGRYRLIDLIGEGGMGKVYKAHDTMMDRDVAIKVLSTELATEPGYEERFRREAYTAARLTEPHIIPIFDAGEIDGRLYLVMPVIDGIDVHTLLCRDGPMSPQRAVHVIEQLAAALDAAHEAGLVHRDVKPSNALVARHDFVYLIDFGIAHDSAATRLTSTGMMVGTLAYMAPERFMTGTADGRADVYALACVLHECLTGATPFPGDSIEQQIAGHLTLDPPRPTEHRPDIPAGLDDAVARGMAKNPDERYQSAHELATAAHRAFADVPHHTPPTAATRRDYPQPASAWQRHDSPTFAAAQPDPPSWPPVPQFVSPVGPGAGPGQHPVPQPAPRADSKGWLGLGVVAAVVLVAILVAAGIYIVKNSSKTEATGITTTPAAIVPTTAAPTTTTPTGPPVVAEAALEGLLLSPDQIGTAIGATGLTLNPKWSLTGMTDNTSLVADKKCLPVFAAATQTDYQGSGWTSVRKQELFDGPKYHVVQQAVVLFSSAHDADAFFTASAQRWPACSKFVVTYPSSSDEVDTVGPISNANGTLSATITISSGGGAQRALAVVNNVVVDIKTLTGGNIRSQAGSAATIARQIAAKVSGQ